MRTAAAWSFPCGGCFLWAGGRVAAPSIRCALLAYRWPRPQQLLAASAAGGARRRCSRLRCCSNPPLRRFTNFQIKQKLQCHYNTGVLGGRGWITQAAHLKKPRRGFFPRRTVRRVDAVRIHPPSLREGYYKTETPVPGSDTGVLGGRGWIRTTEAEKQQIYSLSPLATREHAHILFAVIADCLYILSSEVAFVNYFFHGFSLFLSFSIFLRFTVIKALSITVKDPKTFSVLRSFWSW